LRAATASAMYDFTLLVITAPAVAYLLLDVDAYLLDGGVSLEDMPSLGKASIKIRSNKEESKLSQDQIKLLCSVVGFRDNGAW